MSILIKTTGAFVLFAAAAICIAEYSSPAMSSTSSAPAGRTGSPGDGADCTSCHAGTSSNAAGLITSTVPGAGYVPGQTYTFTGTVSMTGKVKFGFQIAPQDASGNLLGSLVITDAAKTQLVGFDQYVTHKSAGTIFSSGTASWSFDWTAPPAGTGPVTFYGAFNITNNANNSSGDIVRLSTLTVNEDLSAGIEDTHLSVGFSVYPNPAEDRISIGGGQGLVPQTAFIQDLRGRLLRKVSAAELKGNSIAVGDLSSGMYLLNIVSEEAAGTVKFIKR